MNLNLTNTQPMLAEVGIDMENWYDDKSVMELSFKAIDDELSAFGGMASCMRVNFLQWRLTIAQRLCDMTKRWRTLAETGRWLELRCDPLLSNLRSEYYIADLSPVKSIRQLNKDFATMEEEMAMVGGDCLFANIVRRLVELLPKKLRAIIDKATRKKATSADHRSEWERRWTERTTPTTSEVKEYEQEVTRHMERFGHSRKETLSRFMSYEGDAINDNEWGDLYFKYRTDLSQLLQEISNLRGNEQGDSLDELHAQVKRYEWLEKELAALNDDVRQEAPETNRNGETLLPFILDDDERSKIVKALALCNDTGQVAILARKIYEEEILPFDVLRCVDFHRAIIPLLCFNTTPTAIKQAIQKQVK